MRIGIISCSKTKLKGIHKAKDLYQGQFFKKSYKLACLMKMDKIYILSAKYGLVSPNDTIEYYNETLKNLTKKELKEWGSKIVMPEGELYYFAGQRYIKYLPKGYNMYKGKHIGCILQFLDNEIRRLENE